MNIVLAVLLAHSSLTSSFIGTGSLVGEASLSDASSGACELTFGATDFEAETSWGMVARAEGDPDVPSVYFTPSSLAGMDSGECIEVGLFEICTGVYSAEGTIADWETTVLVPTGTTFFDIYAADSSESQWVQTQSLEVACGTCDLYGDFDGDGTVGIPDMLWIAALYGATVGDTERHFVEAPEHMTGSPRDGVIDVNDWTAFIRNWNTSCEG